MEENGGHFPLNWRAIHFPGGRDGKQFPKKKEKKNEIKEHVLGCFGLWLIRKRFNRENKKNML